MKTTITIITIFLLNLTLNYNIFGQCSGENYTMTANYDCSTGTVVISLNPSVALTNLALWSYSPNPTNQPATMGLNFTQEVPFNTEFTITAIELVSPFTMHTFCVQTGECPSEAQVSTESSVCEAPFTGEFCVIDEGLLPADIFITSIEEDCFSGLAPGLYLSSIFANPVDGISNIYSNYSFYIGTSSFNVDVTVDSPTCGATFTANVSGGVGPFEFSWSGQDWMEIGFPNDPETSVDGGFGLINLVVTDAGSGCTVGLEFMHVGSGCGLDYNNDGVVGVAELLAFGGQYNTTGGGCYDYNGNGVVGVTDLLILIAAYGLSGC